VELKQKKQKKNYRVWWERTEFHGRFHDKGDVRYKHAYSLAQAKKIVTMEVEQEAGMKLFFVGLEAQEVE